MFQTKYLCDKCNDIFYKMTEHDPRKKGGRPPACPKCKGSRKVKEKDRIKLTGNVAMKTNEEIKLVQDSNMQSIITAQKAPASGAGNFTKAMDATARMVMEDYGMTNLRDNLRPGDNMVMPLQGKDVAGEALENRVNAVFSPQKNNVSGMAGNQLNSAISNGINSGQFKGYGDVVAQQQKSGIRPTIHYVGDHQERPTK